MSEQFDEKTAASILGLFQQVKDESEKTESAPVCKLNDYNEFETYQMMQQINSEDQI